MFFYKEPYKLIFHYIFFLSFIIIFIQFSTAVHSNEVYKIDEIEISEKFEQDFNKNKIINRAFRIAFNELISKKPDFFLLINSNPFRSIYPIPSEGLGLPTFLQGGT